MVDEWNLKYWREIIAKQGRYYPEAVIEEAALAAATTGYGCYNQMAALDRVLAKWAAKELAEITH